MGAPDRAPEPILIQARPAARRGGGGHARADDRAARCRARRIPEVHRGRPFGHGLNQAPEIIVASVHLEAIGILRRQGDAARLIMDSPGGLAQIVPGHRRVNALGGLVSQVDRAERLPDRRPGDRDE